MSGLFLVPSELELRRISQSELSSLVISRGHEWACCGVGVVKAAVSTAQRLQECRPDFVILMGIAGSYSTSLPTGGWALFDSVSLFGLGVGAGDDFEPIEQTSLRLMAGHAERIELFSPFPAEMSAAKGQLLTVCSASASLEETRSKLRCYPKAIAEDMEGYAVAAACQTAGIPVAIVRGISNAAGNRDKTAWQINDCLDSLCQAMAAVAPDWQLRRIQH